MKLKVYTQNCFGVPFFGSAVRLRKVAGRVREMSPDVVFLQEIQWKSFVNIFRHDDYELSFEEGKYATRGGLLTLVKKTHKFNFSFVKFTAQGGMRQIADRALGKGILDVFLPRMDLHLINTRFMATYMPGRFKDKAQVKQLEQFLEYTKGIKKFVGAGDLNIAEGSESYKRLISGVVDLSGSMGVSHPVLNSKIDFVFGKGVKRVIKKEFVPFDSFVSDHKGISVELEL